MTETQISDLEAMAAFRALGDPTRLRIYRFLCDCCCPVALDESGDVHPVDGPTVGEVCCRIAGVGRITSTISHHLKELRLAGLITVERRGKNMICGVNRALPKALARFLEAAAAGCGPDCCHAEKTP
jgi:ArsR family transcriptional regulator